MPSPFPGMDPFLEHPSEFPQLHHGLISQLQGKLQAILRPPYFAKTGERVWVEASERLLDPDVSVYRHGIKVARQDAREGQQASTALMSPGKSIVVKVLHDEQHEGFVEIYRREDARTKLVCSIEILSPSNKTPGVAGQGLYRKKQQDLFRSQVHFMEIDLLRAGHHTTAVPRSKLRRKAGAYDYHVCAHRFDRFDEYTVYPILMQEPLPVLTVPLLNDDHVALPLQEVFDKTYDLAGFDWVEYDLDRVKPVLSAKQKKWARSILEKANVGKRKSS